MTQPIQAGHGWLILDKPLGMSSAAAVGIVKRLLKPKKIGHGGTLDPLASGILPLALNEATKTFAYVVAHQKGYRFTIRFGEARSTDDAEGEVVATSPNRPTRAALEAALPQFVGEITQVPPVFSAIKVGGQRAYDRARAGEVVEMPSRIVRIDSLKIIDFSPDEATLEVECGGGTYVRSLARDISQLLNTVGYVSFLRRTRVGKFSEKDAISLEKLEKLVHSAAPFELLPIAQVLDDIPALVMDATEVTALRHGKTIFPANAHHLLEMQPTLCLDSEGNAVGIAEPQADGSLKPVRIFNV
jgi:tRNA pseudouridine55 synthase